MIAKRIPRDKGTSSPARLVKYMVAAKGQLDPQTWERTADYILATGDETNKGERVGSYRVTNCDTDDPAAATVLIEATQAVNTRSTKDKTYHLVFSFPPGEEPPLDVLHAIEDELVASIGYADHQRISAVHIDTDHLHVHVAINKVHPTGFQNIEPYYDKKRLMEACERLEVQYGLQRTNHGIDEEKSNERKRNNDRSRSELDPAKRPELSDTRFRRYLRESYNLTFGEPPEAKSFNDLRTLSGSRMGGAAKGDQVLLPGDARSDLHEGRTDSTDSVRRQGNGNSAVAGITEQINDFVASEAAALGAFAEHALTEADALQARPLSGKAADAEAHSGVETLSGYVAREVAPAIRAAKSWQEVHATLADHGLEIKLRGAGLVIGDPELPLWAKASNCGRDLSLKALTDRLGPFESNGNTKKASKRFEPKPRQQHPSSATLFAQYQRDRQANAADRRIRSNQLKKEHADFKAELKRWTAAQRATLKMTAKGPVRRSMLAMMNQQAAAARQKHHKDMSSKWENLFKEASTPTWAEWLRRQAEAGNVDALEVLRSREARELQFKDDLLTAERTDKAKTYIMKALKPQARKDGSMAYRTADGGMVIDRATHVKAEKATTGAALVSLELASKRFAGQALIVEGTDTFKQEVAQLAGLHNLNIRFADPEMEKMRLEAVAEKVAARPEKENEHFGTLVDHGSAPYEHDPKNRQSFFVTIEDKKGVQRTIWGIDLERALAQSGAKIGDQVSLKHVEAEAVRLPNGQTVNRNHWAANVAPKGNRAKATEAPHASGQSIESIYEFIKERNKTRDKISSIDYHRLWTPGDAGPVIYQGHRRMRDGSEVLLLKRGDEMLVKPSSANVVAKATKWKVGSTVTIDARGRFVSGNKTKNNGIEL
ncbi:TraI/MobA(P) family conjugative relaxase [Acinetobacter baumannii]|uniref:TraI/MobA(P) family conjugative relaxase n=1 Tax=Acinetobacter baumannii TaxID=470 RepID=UPI0034E2761B